MVGRNDDHYEIYRAQVVCNNCYANGPTVWGTNTNNDIKAAVLWNDGTEKEAENYQK